MARLASSIKCGRDQDPDDDSPPLKVARGDHWSSLGTEVQPEESSSVPGLQAAVSELTAEIRELKGQLVALLEDIGARSDGILACSTQAAKDYNCKHCHNGQEFREEHRLEWDKWKYELDSCEEESQIPSTF